MVSVIVAVFNLEDYIEKCILSIIQQSHSDLELIIVDDGSTDRTEDICLNYARKDNRVTYVKKKNEGQGMARNIGLKLAKGEYVTYVDGDDWLEKDAIANMYQVAQREDADIVVGDIWYVYVNQGNEEKRYSKIRYNAGQVIRYGECPEKMSNLRTFTWGKLYKRQFLKQEDFVQSSKVYEDTATIPILVLHAKKIVYINTPVYNYLKTRSSSTIYNKEKVMDLLDALQHLYSVFCKEQCLIKYEKEIKRLFWGQIRSLCIAHKVSWREINQTESSYNKLLIFMKNIFEDFKFPDDYEIIVSNSLIVENAIKNLVISEDKIKGESDNIKTARIKMKYNQIIEEYDLGKEYVNTETDDENGLWDCADKLFYLIQGDE